MDRMHFSAVG
jgi:hypothetical protein